ncbi:MAG: class I SAM-dependent methyltransferase [archaeon]|nr:class I SAM-dependent methyltransferase [Nanoarchaeota archaeon]
MNQATEPEAEFLNGMIELQYGNDVVPKLKELAKQVPWAHDWPENKESFWNAEAFMWQHKIERDVRELIKKKLSEKLTSAEDRKNLDLGCGAFSYVVSTGFDCSQKMLDFNEYAIEKVKGDLETNLPFKNFTFDSATAIFVLNYVKNVKNLLKEVRRVIKSGGSFNIVLSGKEVNLWQRQKQVNNFSSKEWIEMFKSAGFIVSMEIENDLYFFSLF